MGGTCQAVDCQSGYSASGHKPKGGKDKDKPKSKVTVFSFPQGLVLRGKWIKALNRDEVNGSPVRTKNNIGGVCELHFRAEDFKDDGKARTRKVLKKGVVPSVFSTAAGNTGLLARPLPPPVRTTNKATPTARREAAADREEELFLELKDNCKIHSLADLYKKLQEERLPEEYR